MRKVNTFVHSDSVMHCWMYLQHVKSGQTFCCDVFVV